ncbi:prolipoprotein diacylglyceryl transferase [Agromyces aurantiacus]|uniref:Phosphatidylglycerol--prolipoprotein diacylglyceryl transferase n=1 Tax=Agromyces aurantiacus TaxID=165814 RepID=A0ABV9R912_9MICO|nr:prolipoprotein diacylglyceryl transferase [Agromyces aurantiacus]MBM7504878.1 prolipoprotein diacylglyceryl transferase [Agromyces aurantiacus]
MIAPISIPSPDPEWRTLEIPVPWGTLNIQMYALCILAGIIIATIWTSRRLTKRGAEPGIVLDVVLWAVPLGIVFARLYHVVTHPDDYFAGQEWWRVFAIWEGGNAIYGSLIGGAIGVIIACRLTGLRFWSFADAVAPGLLLAQAIGRLGNWFNHELFGWPTDLPWGLEIESSNPAFPAGLEDGTLFHPTFLYEIIWNVVGVVVLLGLERFFRLRWGMMFGAYLIWYGAGRAVFETIRVDPSEMFLGIRSNVWASFAAIVIGLVIILVQRRRHPGVEPSVYRPGREWKPADAEVDSDDNTESDSDSLDDGVEGENEPGETAATSSSRSASV